MDLAGTQALSTLAYLFKLAENMTLVSFIQGSSEWVFVKVVGRVTFIFVDWQVCAFGHVGR